MESYLRACTAERKPPSDRNRSSLGLVAHWFEAVIRFNSYSSVLGSEGSPGPRSSQVRRRFRLGFRRRPEGRFAWGATPGADHGGH